LARGIRAASQYILDMARRMYRFIWNRRLSYQDLQVGLYRQHRAIVPKLKIADFLQYRGVLMRSVSFAMSRLASGAISP
jgi:hypothetical protein